MAHLYYWMDEEKNVFPCEDVSELSKMYLRDDNGSSPMDIKKDHVRQFFVSTVFLAINHNFADEEGPPLLFETMIFFEGGFLKKDHKLHQWCMRYSTYEEARSGHEIVVELLKRRKYQAIIDLESSVEQL